LTADQRMFCCHSVPCQEDRSRRRHTAFACSNDCIRS